MKEKDAPLEAFRADIDQLREKYRQQGIRVIFPHGLSGESLEVVLYFPLSAAQTAGIQQRKLQRQTEAQS